MRSNTIGLSRTGILPSRPWNFFIYAMIALAPIFGSVTGAAEISAAVVALLLMRKQGLPAVAPIQKMVVVILLGYFLYFVLRGFFTPDWKGYGGAILSIAGFVYFVPLFLYLPPRLTGLSPLRVSQVATATLFVTFALGLVASLVFHADRVSLFAGNALPFSALVLVTSFVAPLGWHEKRPAGRLLAIIAVLLGLFTIAFLAKSRGPTAAWVVLLVPLLIYIGGARRRTAIAVAAGLAAAVVAAIAAIAVFHDTVVFARFSAPLQDLISGGTGGHVGAGISERLIMYRAGIEAFLAQPIFGYGPQNRFDGAIPFMHGAHFWHHHLHNLFITHAVAGGIIAVLLLIAFLAIPLIIAYSASRRSADLTYMAWVLTLGTIGFGATNMISFYDLTVSFSLFNMLLLMGLASAQEAQATGNADAVCAGDQAKPRPTASSA
ncbi:MAG TPA: O-antigen ligase family protein [Pararhizobium sp.]|nr:O-antigen ligase family protein [Pararhizobium sp.]